MDTDLDFGELDQNESIDDSVDLEDAGMPHSTVVVSLPFTVIHLAHIDRI